MQADPFLLATSLAIGCAAIAALRPVVLARREARSAARAARQRSERVHDAIEALREARREARRKG